MASVSVYRDGTPELSGLLSFVRSIPGYHSLSEAGGSILALARGLDAKGADMLKNIIAKVSGATGKPENQITADDIERWSASQGGGMMGGAEIWIIVGTVGAAAFLLLRK